MDLYNLIISAKLSKGEGGDVSVDPLAVTENGTYTASSGHAYSPVTVSVPTGVFPSGTSQITSNGMYDVTNFASASVNVPGIVPSGTSSITENGIYDITSFASVDVNVSGGGGGDHDAEDGIIQRTISGAYENSRVSKVGIDAFYNCEALTAISFPNATYIDNAAFLNCKKLTLVDIPNASVNSTAFTGCSNISKFIAPNVRDANSQLYTPFINSLEYWEAGQGFYYTLSASKLKTFILHSASKQGFRTMSGDAFPLLECAKLYNTSHMGYSRQFSGCSLLASLYLYYGSVVSGVDGMLQDTPMTDSSYTGSFGSIYVPASLVDSYKVATRWSAFADRITSIVE